MAHVNESGCSAGSSKISEGESVDQTKSVVAPAAEVITGCPQSKEPSAGTPVGAVQQSLEEKRIVTFSSGSQSVTDSSGTIVDPRNSHVSGSELCFNDQPSQRTSVNKNSKTFSVRSSCEVSDVAYESTLMSPRQSPPLQVMDRAAPYEPGRISSSVFTAGSMRQEWSMASNESLFSLHVGQIGIKNGVVDTGDQYRRSSDLALSGEMMSSRASMVAGQEAVRSTVETQSEQAKQSLSDKRSHDIVVQKLHDFADVKVRIPETSWDQRKKTGKIQPVPTSANKKPEKPSSCYKKRICCLCSCARLSCCCSAPGSCCSRPKCSCCKMPSCSSCNCSLGWCCNWNCCSGKSCCSNWSCCCPKGSCCPSCSQCSKAICCWNWSCWKLFCCWNWACCSKGSCCRSWSCCSKESCSKSWSCCSKGSCCTSWSCCSNGSCCTSWSCCSQGSCCKSWSCSSKETCCPSWNYCSKETCCENWNCCSMGSCCKSWSCCPRGSCCKSWNCCTVGSCCSTWNCCSKGICSWKCGSCFKGWNCCSTGGCCCKSFKIKLCCFSSSTKPQDGRVGLHIGHNHHKTKTLGRTGIFGWFS